MRLVAKPVILTIVHFHAPTSTASNEEIDSLYDVVQDMLDNIPNSDITLLMEDPSPKSGKVANRNYCYICRYDCIRDSIICTRKAQISNYKLNFSANANQKHSTKTLN